METVRKASVESAAGIVRFKPDGSAIEQYSSKGGNTGAADHRR
jgi:hypothetical protein